MPSQINRDAAYIARKPGGHLKPGSSTAPVMELNGNMSLATERAWANGAPVDPLTPDRIANIPDIVAQVGVALPAGISLANAFTPKATATALVRYLLDGTLPTGLAFAGGSGNITGTPAAGTAGTYPLQGYCECDTPNEAINFTNQFTLKVNP